jgi:L-alanine-DL-glutamate epimerase-like enolase superfamily enzyme
VFDSARVESEIAVHCHNEFNEPSAVGIAKAVASMNPLFMEDALNPQWSEAWQSLRRQSPIPLLTGEKLEMLRGFKPFIDTRRSIFSTPIWHLPADLPASERSPITPTN